MEILWPSVIFVGRKKKQGQRKKWKGTRKRSGGCGGMEETAGELLVDLGDTTTNEKELHAHCGGALSKLRRQPPEWMKDYVVNQNEMYEYIQVCVMDQLEMK